MNAFVTALTAAEGGITAAGLWGVLTGLAGLVVIGILVGFGNHKLSRVVSGLGRGKAKI